MASDDHSGARPAGPVVLRIKLRYDDLDTMVQRFASNVGKSGLFLPTKSIQPVGTEVKFELRLANDAPVLVGLGRVKHATHPDPANPRATFGMAIELMRVSREGREVIIRMIERRRALGLPDVAIPLPEDIDAARRSEIETQPRAESSGVVRDAMTQLASVPAGEPVLASPKPASGPIGVAKESPVANESPPIAVVAAAGEPERSSSSRIPVEPVERASSSRIPVEPIERASSSRIPVPVLAPEPSRPRRPRVQELIEKATELSAGIQLPVPELDMHVDVEQVLTRARALAGGELEVELAMLREAAAAPVEISVEAASAELARQLGGKPIARRERSARWAPPPAIELRSELLTPITEPGTRLAEDSPAADDGFVAKTRAETELAPSAAIAAVVEAAIEAQPPVDAAALVETEAPLPRADSPSIVPQEAYVIRKSAPLEAQSTAYEEGGDYVDQRTPLPAGDEYEGGYAPNARPDSVPPPEPDRSLMIDDDADISSFERALDAARIHTGVATRAAPPRPDDHELDDDDRDDRAVVLASGEYQLDELTGEGHGDRTQIGAMSPYPDPDLAEQVASQLEEQLAAAEREPVPDDEAEEEISDLDVLAEADEDDADLLGAHAQPTGLPADAADYAEPEADAAVQPQEYTSAQPDYIEPAPSYVAPQAALVDPDRDYVMPLQAYPDPAPAQPTYAAEPAYAPEDDFAARLDLGDDDDEPAPPSDDIDRQAAREFDRGISASEFPDPPSSSYTFAEEFPQAGLLPHDGDGEDFDEPHSYARASEPQPPPPRAPEPPVVGPDPRLLRHGRATTASTEDLEDALAALDVDLDDLAVEQRRMRTRRPTPSSSRPLPGLPVERPRVPTPAAPSPIVPAAPVIPPTSPPRVAHTLRRNPTTGQGGVVKPPTMPPPIPAAALRKPPTQQQPVVRTPPQRASTDEGVLIDFDDDE